MRTGANIFASTGLAAFRAERRALSALALFALLTGLLLPTLIVAADARAAERFGASICRNGAIDDRLPSGADPCDCPGICGGAYAVAASATGFVAALEPGADSVAIGDDLVVDRPAATRPPSRAPPPFV